MNRISDFIKEDVKTIAIAGHVNPDGDCLGSTMGLYLYLKENYPNLSLSVYLENVRDDFRFISGIDEIKTRKEDDFSVDMIITCDASSKDRIGLLAEVYDDVKYTLCIDHHVSNPGIAKVNHILAEASSASEVVFELLEKEKISKNVAEALYLGIVHDTGVFQFSSTSKKTMEIAGFLMDKGIDFTSIIEKTFYQKTYVQNLILGRTLMESILILDKKVIVGGVHRQEMDFYEIGPKDLDGIVNQLRVTKGVEVAIFFYQTACHEYKISMRSAGTVNVSQIAQIFGGGGHAMAAGCTMQGNVYDVINSLTPYIEAQLEKAMEKNGD